MTKYNAFISYSHQDDRDVARAFQLGLQRLACPWYRVRALRVFRDDTDLSADAGLSPSIKQALIVSDHLVLLASPNSAGARWVTQEVEWWLEQHDGNVKRMHIVLLSGDIVWDPATSTFDPRRTTALAPAVCARFSIEPMYADIRGLAGRQLSIRKDQRFRTAVLKVAAPIHGIPMSDLDSIDIREHRRRMQVFACLGVGFVVSALSAVGYERVSTSRRRAAQAEKLIQNDPAEGLRLAGSALGAWRTSEAERSFRDLLIASRTQLRIPHSDPVTKASFDRTGARVITTSGGAAYVWDATNGTAIGDPIRDDAAVSAAAFADHDLVVTASLDCPTRLWRLEDKRWARDVALGDDALVRDVAYDGRGRIVTSGADGDVRVWRNAGDRWLLDRTLPHRDSGYPIAVCSAAFDDSGGRLVTASGKTAHVYDLSTGRETVLEHEGQLTDAAFDPAAPDLVMTTREAAKVEGETVEGEKKRAVRDNPSGVLVWNVASRKAVYTFPHGDTVVAAAFNPSGDLLVSASHDGSARVWDVARQKDLFPLTGHIGPLRDVEISSGGDRVVTAGDDGTARIWSLRVPSRIESPALEIESTVTAAAISSNGELLAVGTSAGRVEFWDIGLRRSLAADDDSAYEDDPIIETKFLPEPRALLVATRSGVVGTRTVGQSSATTAMRPPIVVGSTIRSVDIDEPSGRVLTVGDRVQIWDVKHPERPVTPPFGPEGGIVGAAFVGQGGSRVVTASESGLRVWDASTSGVTPAAEIPSVPGVSRADFSCDGQAGVTAADKAVRTWSASAAAGGAAQLEGRDVSLVKMSCDGTTFATAGGGDVSVRTVADGRQIGAFSGAADVTAIAFGDDPRLLAAGYNDGSVTVWDVAGRAAAVHVVEIPAGESAAAIRRIEFGAEDHLLVVTARDRTVRVLPRERFAPIEELLDEVRDQERLRTDATHGAVAVNAPVAHQ